MNPRDTCLARAFCPSRRSAVIVRCLAFLQFCPLLVLLLFAAVFPVQAEDTPAPVPAAPAAKPEKDNPASTPAKPHHAIPAQPAGQ